MQVKVDNITKDIQTHFLVGCGGAVSLSLSLRRYFPQKLTGLLYHCGLSLEYSKSYSVGQCKYCNLYSNNNKYFARQFLTWNYSGSKQWHENNNKFGKKAWKEIQKYIRKIEEEFGVYTKDVIFPGEIYKNMGRHNGKPFIAKEVVEFDNEW